jgi:uncharacterized protein (TIGR00369 family)
MNIWFKDYTIYDVRKMETGTMLEHIGIELTGIDHNSISGRMPVDHRTIQPMGLLHGGASCVLAESLGSIGAHLIINPDKQYCVGLDINANHIRSAKGGHVYGTAQPIHLGKTTQVWGIEIKSEDGKLICISRLTMAIIEKKTSS